MREASDVFYSVISFSFTKYFVDWYTVDVVFTLSYHIIIIIRMYLKVLNF